MPVARDASTGPRWDAPGRHGGAESAEIWRAIHGPGPGCASRGKVCFLSSARRVPRCGLACGFAAPPHGTLLHCMNLSRTIERTCLSLNHARPGHPGRGSRQQGWLRHRHDAGRPGWRSGDAEMGARRIRRGGNRAGGDSLMTGPAQITGPNRELTMGRRRNTAQGRVRDGRVK